jgi:flavin-dependent dehydrogenase
MNEQSQIANRRSQIAVVGAGPAGASLAIRLAKSGFEVVLIEREKFPRHKLCGEFISPECLAHFRDLGVLDEMFAAGGERVSETVFYAPGGRCVSVPSEWFGSAHEGALSLSRAEMDRRLLEKARAAGVRVLEETQTIGVLFENGAARGVRVKSPDGATAEMAADLTVDATGRANVLGKLAEKEISRQGARAQQRAEIQNPKSKIQNRLVGFKTHLENVRMEKGRCEIYFFRGGYGGLSYVENDRANHCFLVRADVAKKYAGQTDLLVAEVIFENRRARETMRDSKPVFDWLAVSVDGFGIKELNPAGNLFAVGDAAAFIDPFTGSGMLMALEGAETLAGIIAENRFAPEKIAGNYQFAFREKFQRRLRVCSWLRRAAFVPNLAQTLISALSLSRAAREFLARATREPAAGRKSNLKI